MHSLLVQLCTPRQARSKASSTHAPPQRALRYPGALVRHRLQTSPIARACCSPQHLSEAVLCSPLAFFFCLAFFFSALFSRCFPAVDYSYRRGWILLLPTFLQHSLATCRCCRCCCSQEPAVTTRAVSKARRLLWFFPKSVMMEGGEEV